MLVRRVPVLAGSLTGEVFQFLPRPPLQEILEVRVGLGRGPPWVGLLRPGEVNAEHRPLVRRGPEEDVVLVLPACDGADLAAVQLVAASQAYARLRQMRGKVRFSRTLAELKADR